MYNRLDRIPACDRQTDIETDGRTDGQTACHNAYYVSDAKLPIVQNVRDLGVLADNRLTFRDHINSIA